MVCGTRKPSSEVEVTGLVAVFLDLCSRGKSLGDLGVGMGAEACLFWSLALTLTWPAVGQYSSPEAKRCCQDGLTQLPMARSCEQRVARVSQLACREPFLSCCQFAESLRKKNRTRGQVGLARGEGLGEEGDRQWCLLGQKGPSSLPSPMAPSPGGLAGRGTDP